MNLIFNIYRMIDEHEKCGNFNFEAELIRLGSEHFFYGQPILGYLL
jgi:hypothetical protein